MNRQRKKMAVTRGYGCVNMQNDPHHVMVWTIAGMAKTVRRTVGEAFNCGNTERGWNEAKKVGFRVVKVEIRQVRP